MAFIPVTPLPFGMLESAPVIPKLYWDVTSQEQRIKRLCEKLTELFDYAQMLAVTLNQDTAAIKELQAAFKRFMESGFDDYYKAQVIAWIDAHMREVLEAITRKMVFFGLTSDGYFCAYIPDSWHEISFDTGAVFGRSDYGRLILRFEPNDAMGVIDNTYGANASFSNAQLSAANRTLSGVIDQLINDLEITTRRSDVTYAAEFTNLDEVVSNGNF